MLNDIVIETANNETVFYLPVSNYIGNIVYIDWFDVLLLYVLAVALEFCWRNMLAVHYLLLNLGVRAALEHVSMSDGTIIGIASFMALAGLYCTYGGIKVLTNK
jgi:glutaminase